MRSLIRAAMLWALMLGGVNALSQPASPPQERKESGVISGRVTLDGRPAQGVTVVASLMGLSPAKMVEWRLNQPGSPRSTTDSDGRYRIESLAAGTYNISPSAPTLVTVEPAGGTKEVMVAEDATVERIDFSLTRGGVITGKITDTEGAPVIAAMISLKPDDSAISNFSPRELGRMFFTDDRGIYRIFGLPQGRYLVSAGDAENSPFAQVFAGQRRARTYYPGVTDFQKAKPVEVTAGTETLGIDIKLGVAAKGFAVNGRVV
ncbi:MAG TPA: carboxypeptidase-like regulatory domain-containing protein, partial [Blastocatellia bacterium]|nr:carboxypeptidase-like regulatory domain-containing protein [Blastocatellia bacterium]